ncbi:DUF2242 domain-containing protein [Comamonas flocculans]|uniref:DUF2242 domain-containing protein n=1 Tax=Comamonas flocculans TaxID=2597701 RepID=A0A5B8RSE5_9BURK|nr:DUF2242 domain-containing protein [Comamonas flocculans]QEA11644.1 DUF2242 domain-containing protein [Comamonas flocculans]
MPIARHPFALHLGLAALLLAGALTGCARLPEALPGPERNIAFTPNDFDRSDMHTRHLRAGQQQSCEAARRALLSQGYIVETATAEDVKGRKYYQPTPDVHYEVQMRVVCAPDGQGVGATAVFASAIQDRYVIKKVNNSASLGVGGLGSLSLPLNATDDTLVKVGSETINDAHFYASFFDLFARYLPAPGPRLQQPVTVQPVAQPHAEDAVVAPLTGTVQ